MSNINNQQTNACTPAVTLNCQSCHETGICNECWYYSTWDNKGWCNKGHHKIEESNIEKDCYTSR